MLVWLKEVPTTNLSTLYFSAKLRFHWGKNFNILLLSFVVYLLGILLCKKPWWYFSPFFCLFSMQLGNPCFLFLEILRMFNCITTKKTHFPPILRCVFIPDIFSANSWTKVFFAVQRIEFPVYNTDNIQCVPVFLF